MNSPGPLAVAAETHQLAALAVVGDDPVIVRVGHEDAAVRRHPQAGGLAVVPLGHAPLELRLAVEAVPLDAGRLVHDVHQASLAVDGDPTRVLKLPQRPARRAEDRPRAQRRHVVGVGLTAAGAGGERPGADQSSTIAAPRPAPQRPPCADGEEPRRQPDADQPQRRQQHGVGALVVNGVQHGLGDRGEAPGLQPRGDGQLAHRQHGHDGAGRAADGQDRRPGCPQHSRQRCPRDRDGAGRPGPRGSLSVIQRPSSAPTNANRARYPSTRTDGVL